MSDLRIERMVYGPRNLVVSAWRDPALLAEWFCPNPSMSVMAELDVTSGGLWRVLMGTSTVSGTYQEVDLPERLVFSWHWEHEPDTAPSTVRVTFTERSADSTEVLLEHLDLANSDEASAHTEGWAITLDRLDQVVRSRA